MKKRIFRFFFALEIIVFIAVYLFGTSGIQTLFVLKQENMAIENEIAALQEEEEALQKSIVDWNSHSFYQEKVAREQLQMARPNDEIYYLT